MFKCLINVLNCFLSPTKKDLGDPWLLWEKETNNGLVQHSTVKGIYRFITILIKIMDFDLTKITIKLC